MPASKNKEFLTADLEVAHERTVHGESFPQTGLVERREEEKQNFVVGDNL